MENKRITFFIGSMEWGGAERVLANLTAYFVGCGHSVTLVLYHDREIFYPLDPRVEVKVVKKETKSNRFWKNLRWLRRYFKTQSDVVVSFLAPFNIVALLASFGIKTPVIVADRNDPHFVPSNRMLRTLRNFLYRFANGVVLQTEKNQRYFSKAVQKKSTVIYNPVNVGEWRGRALDTEKEDLIVSAGRLMPQKNQAMLLRAFAQIADKYPTYRLAIYGEGEARTELEALAASLPLQDRVLLPGNIKDLFAKISVAKAFVLCSQYEGMPNALVEAMCLGLPCISTAVSGATDLIIDKKNGLLLPLDDQQALQDALSAVLSDPSFAHSLGREAQKLNDTLSFDVIAQQWEAYVLRFCS